MVYWMLHEEPPNEKRNLRHIVDMHLNLAKISKLLSHDKRTINAMCDLIQYLLFVFFSTWKLSNCVKKEAPSNKNKVSIRK